MALLDDILRWTGTLPLWQQDATRRLFQKPEGLSADDYAELYALLKAAHRLPGTKGLTPVPLSRGHLPASPVRGDTVILKGMRDLKHVNCIAPNQTLPFEASGMTVIYGGNSSGKSGYARVMKRACRSRDQKEQVLPDANDPAEQGCIPEAVFDIEVNGVAKSVQWSSEADSPEELASIAIFDCHCARFYLTSEQEVAYLPHGLDIVEALANAVLPELNRCLDQELAGINTDLQPFAHLQGGTKVGQLIAGLNEKTDPDVIKALATLSDEDLKRIEELDCTLGEADPAAKAEHLSLSAKRLKELATRIDASLAWVDDEAVDRLRSLVEGYAVATRAEQQAVVALQSGEELLPGTGEPIWKTLFEAARKFSTERAYPEHEFPNTEDDAVCVLCQQPLGDAGERLKRFEKYIQDDVAKRAFQARKKLTESAENTGKATLEVGADGAIRAELDRLDATIIPIIEAFGASIKTRRDSMLDAITHGSWESIPPICQNPRQKIRDLAAQQLKVARTYRSSADETHREALVQEHTAFKDRKKLSLSLEPVLALLERMKMSKSLEDCRPDLNTGPISWQSKRFASQAVTTPLKEALDEEFETLGMGHINTKLKDRNVKGRIMHQLLLDVPTSSKVEEILSEGEQRAIALGSFLAELRLAEHSAAIVFDDPVSSLDHKRRGKVARRLTVESLQRQVIVLTHDIVFLTQLQTECDRLNLCPGLRFLETIGKHCGAISNGLPWDHKSFRERIDSLEKTQKRFEKLPWPAEPHQDLAREMIQQYSFLRATIERVVQDFVLNATVKRFEDYIRVENLKLVVGLEESEVAEICRLYSHCHGMIESHDPASVKDNPPPTAEELGEDIEALKRVIETIRDRRQSNTT